MKENISEPLTRFSHRRFSKRDFLPNLGTYRVATRIWKVKVAKVESGGTIVQSTTKSY